MITYLMSDNKLIEPPSDRLAEALQHKIDQKTKPIGALGSLEAVAFRIGLCQNSLSPTLQKPSLIVFAGDHGIAKSSGVSAYPQTVTAQMVANFLTGGAAINVFARQNGLKLTIVDAGVNADLPHHPDLISAKIGYGTENFLQKPAMSAGQCEQALKMGADITEQQFKKGCNCLGFGEMGIGNTSSATMLMHRYTALTLEQCVGRGAGLSDQQLVHKLELLQQAAERHQTVSEPLQILETFGGFEIAMMTGAYLKAAELKMIILVDGFIAGAALLAAASMHSAVLDYCFFSHVSGEYGHLAMLNYFGAKPLLNLALRLGEGTGVALALPILQAAVAFLNEMATFAEAGVDNRA
jgi:nicotinate-nucleotide--dimethylbenzimidazole phosphoribosyltransferase